MSRRLWGRLSVAAVALSVVLALTGCGLSLQKLPKPGVSTGDTYPVSAYFTDVLNLPIGAQVRDGPRIVGSVTSMTVHDYRAKIGMRIKNSYHMPVGTTAQVRFDNPLGDQYVELSPPAGEGNANSAGTATFVKPGAILPLPDTAAAPSIEQTLGAFAIVLNGGGIGNIETIATELSQMFAGNEPQIRQLLHNLDVAATDLAGGMGSIDAALDAMAELAKRLNAGSKVLPKAFKALTKSLGILAGQDSQINTLLNGLKAFGAVGNQVIAQSGQQTVQAIKDLVPVVQQVTKANADIAPALGNLAALEAQVPTVTKGGYAEVTATVPLIISSAPSGVGGGGTAPASAASHSLMTAMGALFADGSARHSAVSKAVAQALAGAPGQGGEHR